jgi:hypothetical protein
MRHLTRQLDARSRSRDKARGYYDRCKVRWARLEYGSAGSGDALPRPSVSGKA